ncbi:hypothetical protein D3C87_1415350 [compost metagenome]
MFSTVVNISLNATLLTPQAINKAKQASSKAIMIFPFMALKKLLRTVVPIFLKIKRLYLNTILTVVFMETKSMLQIALLTKTSPGTLRPSENPRALSNPVSARR